MLNIKIVSWSRGIVYRYQLRPLRHLRIDRAAEFAYVPISGIHVASLQVANLLGILSGFTGKFSLRCLRGTRVRPYLQLSRAPPSRDGFTVSALSDKNFILYPD
jgi:hypothetical protein